MKTKWRPGWKLTSIEEQLTKLCNESLNSHRLCCRDPQIHFFLGFMKSQCDVCVDVSVKAR